MDKFLDWFDKKSPTSKIIITVLIMAGLLLMIGVLYVLTTPKSQTSNESSGQNYQPSKTSIPPNKPQSASETSSWPVYKGEGYQINYPPYVFARPGVISGGSGGTALILKGKSGSTEYRIEIQVTNASATPLENILKIFRGFGYRESRILVSNTDAKKFTGQIGGGSFVLQETAIAFENRGKLYKIDLLYENPAKSPKIEQEFLKILETFKLI